MPIDRTITFPPGTTRRETQITILGHDFVENTERFEIRLRNPVAARLGNSAAGQITITDLDVYDAWLEIPPVVEGEDIEITMHFSLMTEFRIKAVILPGVVTGGATKDDDFRGDQRTVQMLPYQHSTTIRIPTYDDNEKEGWEELRIYFLENGCGTECNFLDSNGDADLTLESPSSHTFTPDNWFEPYRLEIAAASDADVIDGMRTIQHSVTTSDRDYEDESPRFVLVSEDDSESDADGSKTRSKNLAFSPGVTATIEHLPERRNGQKFFMSVMFNRPLRTGFVNMRDFAWELDHARVLRAFRINGESDHWGFIVDPRSNDNLTMTMEGGRSCSEPQAQSAPAAACG